MCVSVVQPTLWLRLKGKHWKYTENTNPNFRKSSELNSPIDITLTNDYISFYVRSQILRDEFSGISSRDLYSRRRMNAVNEYVQPMGKEFVIHGLPTIDTLSKNVGICIPDARIIRTPNITHGGASDHSVGQEKSVSDVVGDYREENSKTGF